MKKILLALVFLHTSIFLLAQDSSVNKTSVSNYYLLKNFLSLQKINPGIFSTHIKPQWNSKLYQDQYQQLLAINKKKEFYPELILDTRFVSHAMPTRYSSQNYMWVSTQPSYRNIGEQIASDVIGGVIGGMLSSKKHRFNTNSNTGYYTPIGLKY